MPAITPSDVCIRAITYPRIQFVLHADIVWPAAVKPAGNARQCEEKQRVNQK